MTRDTTSDLREGSNYERGHMGGCGGVCNPSTRGAEAGVSKVQGHLGYCVSLRSGQAVWGDPVLKKKSYLALTMMYQMPDWDKSSR